MPEFNILGFSQLPKRNISFLKGIGFFAFKQTKNKFKTNTCSYMMRKLLYSFLFFISSKSFSKRSFTPSLGLLCVGMFFVVSSNYGQCNFTGSQQSGSTKSIIYNRESVSGTDIGTVTFTGVPVGRYVAVNVIQGLTYTINAVSSPSSFRERITLFNSSNTSNNVGTAVEPNNGNAGATYTDWLATFTGTLFVKINNNSGCSSTGSNSTITVRYTGGSNSVDQQNREGNDSWIAHVYDFSSSVDPDPITEANAFTNSSYLGYFTQANTVTGTTTSFSQGYGGALTPTVPFTTTGISSQNFYGETFAVRYRMRSTLPAGCYFVKVKGDDGVKLTIDGVKVFDAWMLQGPTEYTNVLVYLNGNSQLVLDYYDYDEANVTDFTIYPADDTINSVNAINTAGPVYRCAGSNSVLDGSTITYQGSNTNPSIKFQWQSSPDNATWTDINGATGENYTVSTNPNATTMVYYRRNVIGVATNASSCIYSSESIAVITSKNVNAGTPNSLAATNILCSQFTANWAILGTASGYYLDVSANSAFSSFVAGYNSLDVRLVTSYNVTGLNPNTTYYYRLRAYNKCSGSMPTTNSTTISATTVSPTASISGNIAVCQNATSPNVIFTNPQSLPVTITYNINGGSSSTINVAASSTANISAPTAVSGVFTYNLVSVAYQAVPACTQTLTGSAIITVNPTSIGGTLSGSIVGCTASNGTTFTLTGNVGNVVQWESSTDNFNTPGIIIANTMTNLSVSNVSVTTYYRAVVKSGGCSIAYSSIGSIITGKVTATAATLPVCNGFTANWNKVPGATTYLLDVSTSNTFSPFVPGFNGKDVGDISSFTVTNLLPNVTYYYRIHPIYSCGVYAVASNVISVTTAALPTVAAIGGGANSVCIGASTPAFTNSTSGGTWSITNVTGDASITTGGVVTGVASGTVTVGYTITNGSCSNTVTKSLIINPTNTVSLTSAIGTNAQTVCENTAITNISYATTGATGATVTGLPAGVIGDWSGNVVTISGTPTASSGSPFNYTVTLNGGCGNVFATGTITVNPAPTTPSITKNNDASCSSLGSITITGLSGNWTINQTGDMGARPFNGTSSNFSIQDLTVGTHYFTVTNSTTGCTSGIATVKINDTTVDTEWDGSGWTNGVPDGNKRVTISSIGSVQPFSALAQTNIDACSLIITAGSDVIIPSGVTLTVTNAINSNGKLVFESGSSLLQGKDAVNTGDIVYKRAVSLSRYDVVYWSMPVTKDGFKMHDFSPNTLYDKYFYWDALNGKWVYDTNGKEPMRVGEGYNIRAPQDHSVTSPSIFTGVFTGVPNNGDINVAVVANKWNFLGNPYPSAVDASDLILDTNKDVLGALYFWTHSQAPQIIPGTNTYRYISSDYIVYNGVGSIRVNNPSGPTNEFKGNIAAGQGFFAMPTVSQIKFNNDLRRGSSENTQFYKTAKTKKIEKNRLWLNATNSQGAFKQMLIGYMEGATNDIDISYDAITMGSNSYVDLYSINNTKRLTIQGRALPFDNTEVIPLGFKCGVDATGDRTFTISIDHADGFFTTQEVYLEDKALGIITDLRKENYTFTSGTGTYSNRFALRYTNKALGNDDFENLENNVLVSVKDKIINVISSKETIKEISVYNIGAELLYSNTKVNASELQIKNLHSSDQVLLVNITLENGHAFTKKIIFSNL